MRTIKLSDGRTLNIRPLDAAQIKALGPVGFSYVGYRPKGSMDDAEVINDTISGVIDVLEIEASAKDYPKIFAAVVKETYGDKEEEKNS